MWSRRSAVVLVALGVPVLGAGAWAAASSIETRPAPQVVVPPEAVSARTPSTTAAPRPTTSTSVDDHGNRREHDTTPTTVDDHGNGREHDTTATSIVDQGRGHPGRDRGAGVEDHSGGR